MNVLRNTILKDLSLVIGLFLLQYIFSFLVIFMIPQINWNKQPLGSSITTSRLFIPYATPNPDLSELWQKWDSNYYLAIAQHGYEIVRNNSKASAQIWAYFPLYPMLIKLIATVGGYIGNYRLVFITGLIISLLASAASLFFLKKLLRLLHIPNVEKDSIVLTLIAFPTSYFLLLFYPESLFLLLSILMFYFLFTKRILFASICLGLALATRPQAVTLVVPFIVYFIGNIWTGQSKKKLLALPLYLVVSLVPLILFSQYIYTITGNYFTQFLAQGSLQNTGFYPFSYFVKYIQSYGWVIRPEHMLTVLLLLTLTVGFIATIWRFKQKIAAHLRLEWATLLFYAGIYIWMLTAVENLNSIYRYAAVNFVFFLIPVVFFGLTYKRPFTYTFTIIACVLFHALFLTLFLLQIPAYGF